MDFDCFIMEQAYSKGLRHAIDAASSKLESMGLLTGTVIAHQGRTFTVVTDYLTAGNDSTSVSVKFNPQAFSELTSKYTSRANKNEILVGWMHSHPSYGCFLSTTDVKTQRTYFAEPFNVALVVDPVQAKASNSPCIRAYRLDLAQSSGYREISFAIIKKKFSHATTT